MKTFSAKIAWKTKNILNQSFNFVLFLFLVLFQTGCNLLEDKVVPENNNYKIEVGAFTQAGTASIGTSGGTLTVKNGSSIDGLSIAIPKNGLTSSKTFNISIAQVSNNPDKENFNILTPLIRIENGGGYADSVMKITIPCKVPKDHFAMGFYYDIDTQELEGIPVVAINDNNIVLATRHFSGKAIGNARVNHTKGSNSWADMIVASIPTNKLFETQESGFRPGIDDWEFANYGSYIAKNGHCTGQSVTAMWYYATQKLAKKEPQLYGRFEKIPGKLWQDNRNGYRFASVVWADQTAKQRNAWMSKFNAEGTKRFGHDSLHFLSFAYSIHLTKKPQLVEVWHNTGGHAMIVYKTSNGLLSIADPNFPSTYNHLITLNSNGRFSPYESKSNVDDPSTLYPEITYVAKSALFNFESISARYEEMKKGTIGDYPPNKFPSVELMYLKGKEWVPIKDTLSTELDSITIGARCVGCAYVWQTNLTFVEQYNRDGLLLAQAKNGLLKIKVESGENLVPFYIKGSPDNLKWKYIDFKMPLIKKEKQATFEYWLAGENKGILTNYHFGSKDNSVGYAGIWSGNTFKVDKKMVFPEGTAYAKITAVANGNKTVLNTFNVEMYIDYGVEKLTVISLDGKNLPLERSDTEYLYFNASGVTTCQYLTRVEFNLVAKVDKWACDETSFVKFKIPKP